MKRIAHVLVGLTVALASSVVGQESLVNRLGMGISFDPNRLGQAATRFHVPININEKFRVEPTFGLSSFGSETRTSTSQQGSVPSTTTRDASAILAGAGIYFVQPIASSLNIYIGPRVAFSFVTTTEEIPFFGGTVPSIVRTEMKETDFTAGGVFGAEYFPLAQFSVGGEFSFNYTSYGNPNTTTTITPPPSPPIFLTTTERKQHLWSSDALFFVRWYFLQTNN